MSPGPLAAEAYGSRTTAPDMLRFIHANMNLLNLDDTLRRAIINTRTGYYRIGVMTQDLIWEQYRYPIPLSGLLQGNSDQVMFEENPAVKIDPPSRPRERCRDKQDGLDERLRGVRRVHSADERRGSFCSRTSRTLSRNGSRPPIAS